MTATPCVVCAMREGWVNRDGADCAFVVGFLVGVWCGRNPTDDLTLSLCDIHERAVSAFVSHGKRL